MISVLFDTPANVVAFNAANEISQQDFDGVVYPYIDKKSKLRDELNCLLLLHSRFDCFNLKLKWNDAIAAIKSKAKWGRTAIVSDDWHSRFFAKVFSNIMPGIFRCFKIKDIRNAIDWAATGVEKNETVIMEV